jgi:hypothetical protein
MTHKTTMQRKVKHPKTPDDIADELMLWFENGKGGLVRLSQRANPEVTAQVELWFEKGRARLSGLAAAVRNLRESDDAKVE